MKFFTKPLGCLMLLIAALGTLLICGCGSKAGPQGGTEQPGSQGTGSQPYTVTDDTGRSIALPKKPTQIVSTTYGTDEILVELVDLKRIKSFCRHAGDPEITFITPEQLKQVGHRVGENLEAVVALQPDLVIVSVSTNYSMVKTLEEMKIPVYVAASPKTYEQMRSKIMGIAKAVGEEQRGEQVIRAMDNRLAAVHEGLKPITKDKERVVMAFSYLGAIGRKGNLLDDMLTQARVRNGAAEAGLVQGADSLSKEKVIEVNPEVFIIPTWTMGGKNDPVAYAEQLRQDPAYKQVRAVQNNRLVGISDRYKYVASQHIVEAIEAIAKAVYPEYFKQ